MSISIIDVVSACLEKPSKPVLVNRFTGEVLRLPVDEHYRIRRNPVERDGKEINVMDWIPFEAPSPNYLANMRYDFLRVHSSLAKTNVDVHRSASFNKWAKTVGLWDEWVNYFADTRLDDLVALSLAYKTDEAEATKNQYKKLRKLLEKYESLELETSFSSDNYFSFYWPDCNCEFVILGNNKDTYGISFYIGNLFGKQYRTTQRDYDTRRGSFDLSFLGMTINLYCNDKDKIKYDFREPNPLGGDNRFSILIIANGWRIDSYLSRFSAQYLINCLTSITYRLPRFIKANDGIPFHEYAVDFVFSRRGCRPERREPYRPDEMYTFQLDFLSARSPKLGVHKISKETWDFTFRSVVTPFVYGDDPRFMFIPFVGITADHKTGIISNMPTLIGLEDGDIFVKNLIKGYEDINFQHAPKIIYVNNNIDLVFAKFIFKEFMDLGTEIKLVDEHLFTDEAYAMLSEGFLKEDPLPDA